MHNATPSVLSSSLGNVFLLLLVLACISTSANAQTYRSGQHIEPAFEGWRPNPDGSFNMMFGYMNENWEEEPDVEVGEHNFFRPAKLTVVSQPTSCRDATGSRLK